MVTLIETESRMAAARVGVRQNGELLFNGHRVCVWEGGKGLEVGGSDELYT